MTKHFILPDTQVKPGVPLDHLDWAGKYCVEKKPDVIVCLGDFADMHSLSSYDVGKKSFEGRKYVEDIESANKAMELFLRPIKQEQERLKKNKEKAWKPKRILCLGNHEDRITRAVENDRKLEGLLNLEDLPYEDWEVYPFLEPVIVDGVSYCHYFCSGILGRPITSARALNTKKHQSCIMGHVQRKEIDIQYKADGTRITSIFAGSFYQHQESYLNPQGNASAWQGVWMLHEVNDGQFDELPISLEYLKKKYGTT